MSRKTQRAQWRFVALSVDLSLVLCLFFYSCCEKSPIHNNQSFVGGSVWASVGFRWLLAGCGCFHKQNNKIFDSLYKGGEVAAERRRGLGGWGYGFVCAFK